MSWERLERRPDPPRVVLSTHARERAASMGVPEEHVTACIADPETDAPSNPTYAQPGARVATRGYIAVPYSTDHKGVRVAITVLWAGRYDRGPVDDPAPELPST